uniref:Ragulator complex protein LAMTOR1 n=1 Tax=Trichuris muris TaxID=70415 RepID=A0A5S6QXS2_TRIMR
MAKKWLILLCPCCNFTDNGDSDERSKLLEGQRPNSGTTHVCPPDAQQSGNVVPSAGATQATDDEQEFLNKVLQQTASEVIDVAALESQTLEPREYVERARQYNAMLSHLNFSPSTKFSVPLSLQPVTSVEASIKEFIAGKRHLHISTNETLNGTGGNEATTIRIVRTRQFVNGRNTCNNAMLPHVNFLRRKGFCLSFLFHFSDSSIGQQLRAPANLPKCVSSFPVPSV